MTPEAKVKANVVKILKKYEVYYFFTATGGFGRSGVPDVVCCVKGKFLGIECKANGNKPTALQEREIEAIRSAKGMAMIVHEDNLDALETVIKEALA